VSDGFRAPVEGPPVRGGQRRVSTGRVMMTAPQTVSGSLSPAPSLQKMAQGATIEYRSTPDVIAAVLREAIISGAVAGGSQLRQSNLAADFGVSVIPVREALQQLTAEGFVILQRNRGALVAEVSIDETAELFDVRVALEGVLMEAALPRLTAADLEKAAEYQRAFDAETDINQWGRLNWRFHEALYLPAERPRTLAIVANINRHIDRLLRLQMSLVDGKRKSRREHGAILTACRRGDADRAVSLLKQHIRGVEAIILRFAEKRLG
jgi:DNA-binding GntR family transcriptional regulator